MTVMMIEAMTNTMVNSMYLPIRGTALEVEGISSTMTSRNTVKDSRTEMLRVIFSPVIKNPSKSLLLLSFSTESICLRSRMWVIAVHSNHVCAFAVLLSLPASKAVTRLGTPESLTASASALRWELPGMAGLRCRWWIFLLARSISWVVYFGQCSICT